MTETVHERRTRECQDALRGVADAVVLFPGPNLTYLTGFDEEPGERHLLLFVTPDDLGMVVPELYDEQVRAESWIHPDRMRPWADGENPAEAVDEVVADLGLADADRVLLDDRMWALFTRVLRTAMPDAVFGLASEVLTDLRICKDEAELDRMRRVAALTDEVSREVRALGEEWVGRTERELAREIRDRLLDRGAEGLSFETVVGSGPNGSQPHYRHGDREIRRGDPVVLDFGARLEGYPSDQTRTVVFAGDPPGGFEDAFDAVRTAQEAAVEVVEPGVTTGEIDRAARSVLEDRGYGDRFVHRTGHGVGLELHEEPYIVEGGDRELEPGMVFSVEPGVYLEGEYGIRIEDLVVVTDDGCERLNDSPRGWEPPE